MLRCNVVNPRQWAFVFAVTLLHVALNSAKTKRGSLTTIQSQPRLGLVVGGVVARSNATPLPGRLSLGQRANGPPSRRVTEPTSRRARKRQEFELPSSAPTPRAAQDAPREYEVRTAPCPGFRLLSSPTHSRAWPFAVARRATQVSVDATATTLGAVEERSLSHDLITRPPRANPRRP